MPRERLFPKPPDESGPRTPYERFSDLASKVLRVPKEEIDKREKEWKQGKAWP